jgi:pantoate--beta-alanine ligase
MGALHEGHLALIRRARKIVGAGGTVVVSIFVNPTQFGPHEDYSKYPRPMKRDLALCRELGVDAVFLPSAASMYAPDTSAHVDEVSLSDQLCGKSRPGHFRGVCTVVCKLFHIVQPDAAVFGEKDFQQLAIIRRMVRDLSFDLKIVPCSTVRERDGLALSSRNAYLDAEQRGQAPMIHAALSEATRSRKRDPLFLQKLVTGKISSAPGARIDYVEVVDAETLMPATARTKNMRLAVAVFFGKTRLIDNIAL